ncbi:HAD family hydrolase [Luteimonas sp. MC1782]|uniref:HAD family hydrolase n=1 Tax=Luteimonas sp. MC1782 TaxID=2760305 RepID=UPI0015FF44CB|nr:HAD family hydrolase [Luteimonas sp. MC1782]MBB1473574.1 HAD family hydrolase [Luteimonas sp. MC1782]
MGFDVRAITLDLDDTLWPFAPIGVRIEHALDDWMRVHCPATAAMFPVAAMRALREQMHARHPQLAHDMSALRRLTIEHALRESGADLALVDPAYEVFFAARNEVEFYPEARDALARMSARVPVVALSNGNADLGRIGIRHHFAGSVSAQEHGAAKPDASIFLAACAHVGVAPAEVLHVGDHPEADVAGAARAGLRSCWINRRGADGRLAPWRHRSATPDLNFDTLSGLADWLEAATAAPGDDTRSTPA